MMIKNSSDAMFHDGRDLTGTAQGALTPKISGKTAVLPASKSTSKTASKYLAAHGVLIKQS
jgi:hypothetical protein